MPWIVGVFFITDDSVLRNVFCPQTDLSLGVLAVLYQSSWHWLASPQIGNAGTTAAPRENAPLLAAKIPQTGPRVILGQKKTATFFGATRNLSLHRHSCHTLACTGSAKSSTKVTSKRGIWSGTGSDEKSPNFLRGILSTSAACSRVRRRPLSTRIFI